MMTRKQPLPLLRGRGCFLKVVFLKLFSYGPFVDRQKWNPSVIPLEVLLSSHMEEFHAVV